MRVDSTFIFLLLKLALVPYAVAVLMPGWRCLVGIAVIIGGALAALWIQDWIMTSNPPYHEGAGDGLGRILALIVTVSFVTGVLVRGLSLVLRSRGLRLLYVVAICAFGFAIVPAFFYLPAAWEAWQRRPPAEACANATFRLNVAEVNFNIPASSMFNVYLGRTSAKDVYYLGIAPSLREFCSVNDNGKLPVTATLIWLHPHDLIFSTKSALCTETPPEWARTYCAAYDAVKRGKEDDVDFPLDIHVFAPNQVNLGEFGGSRSTYQDSLHPPSRPGTVFIKSDALVSGEPLTFSCMPGGNEYWCTASYLWRNGAILSYTFRSGRDDVIARGQRIDDETRKFLGGLTPQ
jgi:hypothetical protein